MYKKVYSIIEMQKKRRYKMVVLDILKEIEPICVSKKLLLYIKNPDDKTTYYYTVKLKDEFENE